MRQIWKMRCTSCNFKYSIQFKFYSDICPNCNLKVHQSIMAIINIKYKLIKKRLATKFYELNEQISLF